MEGDQESEDAVETSAPDREGRPDQVAPDDARVEDSTATPERPSTKLTVKIAMISAAAALLGSVIGVVGSLIATHMTNAAFDARTQRDFLHTQRLAAVTKEIADGQHVITDINALSLSETRRTGGRLTSAERSALVTAIDRLERDSDLVSTDNSRILIVVGNSEVLRAADRIRTDSEVATSYFDGELVACEDKIPGTTCHNLEAQTVKYSTRLAGDLDGLAVAARNDIGATASG